IEPASIDLLTTSLSRAFLVTSDVNYPGWTVLIDGEPTELIQTDYILRGVIVPPGDHRIRFEFKPVKLYFGAILTLLSALFLIVILIISKLQSKRRVKLNY
ncbi:MAG: hypothetical protein ACRD4L_06825, partial [Pyrinomonadaceae bacterium]